VVFLAPRDLSRPPGGPKNHLYPISVCVFNTRFQSSVSSIGFGNRFKNPIQEAIPETDFKKLLRVSKKTRSNTSPSDLSTIQPGQLYGNRDLSTSLPVNMTRPQRGFVPGRISPGFLRQDPS